MQFSLQVCKAEDYEEDLKLAYFKRELQELLVLYTYKIPLKAFVKHYVQRYARPLDLPSFGVDSLEGLFQKVLSSATKSVPCASYGRQDG